MKWRADPRKAAYNRKAHGVSFEDAVLVFADPLAQIEDDSAHEAGRWTILGKPYPFKRAVLFVVYIEISDDEVRAHQRSPRHQTREETL